VEGIARLEVAQFPATLGIRGSGATGRRHIVHIMIIMCDSIGGGCIVAELVETMELPGK